MVVESRRIVSATPSTARSFPSPREHDGGAWRRRSPPEGGHVAPPRVHRCILRRAANRSMAAFGAPRAPRPTASAARRRIRIIDPDTVGTPWALPELPDSSSPTRSRARARTLITSAFIGQNPNGVRIRFTGSSPSPARTASVTWATMRGAVNVPHFGVSAGASCANRATSAARSSAFQSVGMCAILCVITHRAPAVPA